ncbi:regulator of G-protein signaling 9-binding protein [Lampris incognitus]|uniref:regulator of G-protein signaling 9-binding protein n=1 Tax=Lampris incognitus TaxID=2546036 RepID=UPI0024B633BD|nr:regulator of G-protein signaling 9-binding protein [Lampris incognitus]
MNRWRRSADELQARRKQLWECEHAQEALSKVSSCFQQLASSIGSTSDGSFLREEMGETRALAYRICSGLARRLLCLLSECDSPLSCPEERKHAERLWVLSMSALENFLLALQRANDLTEQFPLTQRYNRRSLVNTGSGDSVAGLSAHAASVQTPWLNLEEEPSPDIAAHIAGLDVMIKDMQLKVSIPFWSVEATQQPGAEASGSQTDPQAQEDNLEELMEVEVVSHDKMAACCHLGCMLCCSVNQ